MKKLTFGKIERINQKPKEQIPISQPKITDYVLEETIGEGTYGKVKVATHIKTNEKVAIKIIHKYKLTHKNDDLRMKNEMKILTELNHPNILKAFEVFEDESNYYIVMEKPEKGDLFKYICSKGRLSIEEATFMYYQIVNAVQFLHKNKIVHRDMKPENILLTKDYIVKIGDFGFSKFYKSDEDKLATNCGSACYASPEVLRGIRYKPQPVDIWGIGIILYCMICGQLPFEDKNEDNLIRKVISCQFNCPLFVKDNIKNLFRRIFCPNPNDRLNFHQIKMNSVYCMGKASFNKYFRIYGEDGDLLPQVKIFLKEKSLNSLQIVHSMEVNKFTERTTAYKILFNKYMHNTPWYNYYIPKKENRKLEYLSEKQINKFQKRYLSTITLDEDEKIKNKKNLFFFIDIYIIYLCEENSASFI